MLFIFIQISPKQGNLLGRNLNKNKEHDATQLFSYGETTCGKTICRNSMGSIMQNKWNFQGCLRKIHEEFPRVVTPNFKASLYGFILDSLHAVLSEDLQHRISCITISIQAEYYSFSQLICSSFVLHRKSKSTKRPGPACQICFFIFQPA